MIKVTTKTVQGRWKELIDNIGNEIEILIDAPLDEISKVNQDLIPAIEVIFRNNSLHISPGGGGKYGEISVLMKNYPKKL